VTSAVLADAGRSHGKSFGVGQPREPLVMVQGTKIGVGRVGGDDEAVGNGKPA
jgi:hypothetical protein